MHYAIINVSSIHLLNFFLWSSNFESVVSRLEALTSVRNFLTMKILLPALQH